MDIKFNWDDTVNSAPTGFKNAIEAAGTQLDNLLSQDNITLTVNVGYGEIDGTPIVPGDGAEGGPVNGTGQFMSYANVIKELDTHAPNGEDPRVASQLAQLPTTAPPGDDQIYVADAQLKLWGLMPANSTTADGQVGFSSGLTYALDPSNRAVTGEYDLQGMAIHEITHALIDRTGDGILQLADYTAPGVFAPANGTGYFSLDGGVTNLGAFSPQDTTDWVKAGDGDPLDLSTESGIAETNITQTDLALINWLGLADTPATPPPPPPIPPITPPIIPPTPPVPPVHPPIPPIPPVPPVHPPIPPIPPIPPVPPVHPYIPHIPPVPPVPPVHLTPLTPPAVTPPNPPLVTHPPIIPTPPAPVYHFAETDLTTGVGSMQTGAPYSGPVAGLTDECINITQDNLNITAMTPNSYIVTGDGTDAIDVSKAGGNNVIDGQGGSNFLVGGKGNDTFFANDDHTATPSWTTLVGLHTGDNATIWGLTPSDFKLNWLDGGGTSGYTGLTAYATAPGKPGVEVTLAGLTSADLHNGKLSASYGTVSNVPYMDIAVH